MEGACHQKPNCYYMNPQNDIMCEMMWILTVHLLWLESHQLKMGKKQILCPRKTWAMDQSLRLTWQGQILLSSDGNICILLPLFSVFLNFAEKLTNSTNKWHTNSTLLLGVLGFNLLIFHKSGTLKIISVQNTNRSSAKKFNPMSKILLKCCKKAW